MAKEMKNMLRRWKTGKDVKKLVVSNRIINHGNFGIVYHGRVWFKGKKKPLRVAVKRFSIQIGEEEVARYREVIRKLRRAGVPIPKVGFIQHKGRWVQVMTLFGSTSQGSKI